MTDVTVILDCGGDDNHGAVYVDGRVIRVDDSRNSQIVRVLERVKTKERRETGC